MKKPFSLFFDVLIIFWAASGVLMAFGSGTLFAFIRSAFLRKNPILLATPTASRARGLLRMIFSHLHLRKRD